MLAETTQRKIYELDCMKMKMSSTSLVIREFQIKTIKDFSTQPAYCQNVKTTDNAELWRIS